MSAHKKALKTIKKYNQNAKVGMTHALQEWEDDDNNKLKEYLKYHLEDKFLANRSLVLHHLLKSKHH